MEKLTAGYSKIMNGKSLNNNAKDSFNKALKSAVSAKKGKQK